MISKLRKNLIKILGLFFLVTAGGALGCGSGSVEGCFADPMAGCFEDAECADGEFCDLDACTCLSTSF